MKRINTKILLTIIALLIVFHAHAQEKKFNFGLKIAPAISWLNIENDDNVSTGISSDGAVAKFNWGFFGIYNATENFGLVSGFNVNHLGGNIKYSDGGGTSVRAKHKYSEIQIPFLLQMQSNEILDFRIFFQLGIAGGYFLKARDGNDKKLENETSDFNSAFIISGGIYYPFIGGLNLMGQFKYNGGLNNISRRDGFDGKIKTSFVELTFGLMF